MTPPTTPHWSRAPNAGPQAPHAPRSPDARSDAHDAAERVVIPYDNFWILRSAIELGVVLMTAWMARMGLVSFVPSLAALLAVLVLTRRVIVIDRQRGSLKIARVLSRGPGPETSLSTVNPTAEYRSAKVNVYQTSGNVRRVIGTKIIQILELRLGPGAPNLQPATESMIYEVAGVVAAAVGRPLTAEMQRAMRNQKPRAVARAALSTLGALALASAVLSSASSERAEVAGFFLGAPLWIVVAMRWSHAVSLFAPKTKPARYVPVAIAALAALATVSAAFAARSSGETARTEAAAAAQRDRAEQQARQDAIPAQRDTAPPMAAATLPSLSGPVDRALVERSLSEAGFAVSVARYPRSAQWQVNADGRAVSLSIERYDTEQSALSVRRVLARHWLRVDKRQDATREALVQALASASSLERATIEPILLTHGATRVIAGGDDPYTFRATRGRELIAVTAVPFETDDREHRRCVADGSQALCATAFHRRGAHDPAWLVWALHAALGRATAQR